MGLLRTLAAVLEPSQLVLCPAFHADPPSAAFGWDAHRLGSWAAPPSQQQQQGPAQAAGAGGAAVVVAAAADGAPDGGAAEAAAAAAVDLTEDPLQTPAHLLAAATWQAAMVDCFGVYGGWDLLVQVRLWPACRCSARRTVLCQKPKRLTTPGFFATCKGLPGPLTPLCLPPLVLLVPTLQLLSHPERLGDYLWAFLQPLAAGAGHMLPERRSMLVPVVDAVIQLVRSGLEAAPDLSAVEGTAPHPEIRVARVRALPAPSCLPAPCHLPAWCPLARLRACPTVRVPAWLPAHPWHCLLRCRRCS